MSATALCYRGSQGRSLQFPAVSNLSARLIAGQGVTADGSGLVSAWADQSGGDNGAAQATAINQPTAATDRLGRPVVQFWVDPTAANSDWMTFASAVDFNAQAVSIFVAARILYPGESSVVGLQNYAGGTSHLRFTNGGNTALPETLRNANRDSGATGPLEPTVLSVVSGTGTSVEVGIGPDLVSGLTAVTADTDCLGAWLGTYGPGAYQSMDVYEVLVYNRAVSTGESAQIRAYLAAKYATRTTQWPNNIVFEGDSITQGVGTVNKRGYPTAVWRDSTAAWRTTNMGSSGATISTLTTRAAAADASKRASATRNVLMVLIGRNDVASNTGTVVYSNLVTYIQARVAAGNEVWVGTCIASSATFQPTIDDLNGRIRGTTGPGIIADAGAAKVIDFASLSQFANAAASGNTTYYQSDQTHPTAAGNQLMADLVAAQMP